MARLGKARRRKRKKTTIIIFCSFLAICSKLLLQPVLSTSSNNKENDNDNIIDDECGIYLAKSSIPGAGLGMFAGRSFRPGQLVSFGDVVVPIVDLPWHTQTQKPHETHHFLWGEYVWSADTFPEMEDESHDALAVWGASGGMGAAVNCNLPLVNVIDDYTKCNVANVPPTSPGAGAFTPYHSRTFHATTYIPPGMELFASYGGEYFYTRTNEYGYMPMMSDFPLADQLLQKYLNFKHQRLIPNLSSNDNDNNNNDQLGIVIKDLYDLMLSIKDIYFDVRHLQALPTNETLIQQLLETGGGTRFKDLNASVYNMDWLRQNGKCMDNIRDGTSTIPMAGRGAFATRNIFKNDLVSPAPLIHIPNRAVLNMYDQRHDDFKPNTTQVAHKQLLLNYCFGHKQSTLLLCPYGLLTMLINHGGDKNANSKIVWSQDMRHRTWLDHPVDQWGGTSHSGLSFDIVATRNIKQGEEILLNYGHEWDKAWNEHVRNFKVQKSRHNYKLAAEWNDMDDLRIRTIHEMPPYHVEHKKVWCRAQFIQFHGGNPEQGDDGNIEYLDTQCLVLHRNETDNTYLVQLYWQADLEIEGKCQIDRGSILFKVPRDGLYFQDEPYVRDHAQKWSFRHEMMIPNEIFPETWKNI